MKTKNQINTAIRFIFLFMLMHGYSSVFASDIGVICSTDKEANLLSKELSSLSIENVHNRNVVKGQIKGKNIVVIVSRMGKAMNAATAQFLYDYYHTDQIVSVGFSARTRCPSATCPQKTLPMAIRPTSPSPLPTRT